MKVSEETIRVRSRADEKARYIALAKAQGVTLSALVRRALRDGLEGRTVARVRSDDARIRMALNQLAVLAADRSAADAIVAEAKTLLGGPRS